MRTLKKRIHESHSLRFARQKPGLLTNHDYRELLPHGIYLIYLSARFVSWTTASLTHRFLL